MVWEVMWHALSIFIPLELLLTLELYHLKDVVLILIRVQTIGLDCFIEPQYIGLDCCSTIP